MNEGVPDFKTSEHPAHEVIRVPGGTQGSTLKVGKRLESSPRNGASRYQVIF